MPTKTDGALSAADDEVCALLDEGWEPRSIALLTTGHRHPEQQAQTEHPGQAGYWRSFWEGEDVFYAAACRHCPLGAVRDVAREFEPIWHLGEQPDVTVGRLEKSGVSVGPSAGRVPRPDLHLRPSLLLVR